MFLGELRPFQEEAFKKILDKERVVLAYHMGLGKTVVTIAVVEHLLEEGRSYGGMVICPASLKYQWEREIERFSDTASVLVIDGTPQKRKSQYLSAYRYEYVILTYEQTVNDWDMVRFLRRDFVVLDEATAIKNPAAKRTKAIKRLDGTWRLALTGQPVENKPEELYSIMQWACPGVLGRFDIFDRTFIIRDNFGNPRKYRNLDILRERVDGWLIRKRRDDPDVRDAMPAVEEETILVTLDSPSRKLYRHITDELLHVLANVRGGGGWDVFAHYHGGGDSSGDRDKGEAMSRMLGLRMLCDHPELLRVSADLYDETWDDETESVKAGSKYALHLREEGLLDPLRKSPKLEVAVEVIDEILAEDPANKIVLFSFFKEMLALTAEAIEEKCSVRTALFTGDMTAKKREAEKRRFQADPDTRVFLSSDAGGYGVDLPQANYLISLDLPWSAGKLDQRNARIIRLSSEWESVVLINILVQGSIEQRLYDMLAQKRRVASAFLDGEGVDTEGELKLDLGSLSDFLSQSEV